MTELQINFTVVTLASFPFSQGLCFLGDWVLRSFLSPLHTAHGQQMFAVSLPVWYWYQNNSCTVSTDVAPFKAESLTNTPVARTTCFWRPAHSCSLQSVALMACPELTLCIWVEWQYHTINTALTKIWKSPKYIKEDQESNMSVVMWGLHAGAAVLSAECSFLHANMLTWTMLTLPILRMFNVNYV